MKILSFVLLALFFCQSSFATCELAYSKKVTKIESRDGGWLVYPTFGLVGLPSIVGGVLLGVPGGVAVLAGGAVGVLAVGGVLKLSSLVSDERAARFELAASVIHNSYLVDQGIAGDLQSEADRLSNYLNLPVDPKELGKTIASLDGKNAFCQDGKAANLGEFRRIVRAEYDIPEDLHGTQGESDNLNP